MTFFDRLNQRMARTAPLCVGIDPHPGVLDAWGLPHSVAGVEKLAMTLVEALADQVAVFKPQSAFFERWGSPGIAVLERCVSELTARGALVIADVKRGDIGSTMTAYAEAYLDSGPLSVDAITLSAYLGFDALAPAIQLAARNGRGVFVLARTSNPEGADLQLGHTVSGQVVAQSIVDQAVRWNQDLGQRVVGVVVGGTHADLGVDLTRFDAAILIPGIGAQGGTVSRLAQSFRGTNALLLPSVSREVLKAGGDPAALVAAVDSVIAA
ncbi:MAG: orotidine-5'-phosphate decarboxylase [Propionibacteriaceae bacterium]|jgi:orotidine-5'-phosphate decarboxylase|nr:orotidine-5'-phosphate decarboxylase [Propionibacteriaceae bacterium]